MRIRQLPTVLRRQPLVRRVERAMRNGSALCVALGDTNQRFFRPGWVTVDLVDADYLCDFREDPLPLPDGSAAVIHASHLVEHLSADVGRALMQECWRCLAPGGTLRLSTPDLDLLLDKYHEGDWRWFLAANGKSILQGVVTGTIPAESLLMHNMLIGWLASYSGRLDTGGGPIADSERVNRELEEKGRRRFRDWCVSLLESQRVLAHVHVYDREELAVVLGDVGFSNVRVAEYGDSRAPQMQNPCIDRPARRLYSMYLEATK